jgi:zinc transport system permease protein
MLIIPAAAARPLSRTPEQMALTAAIIGSASAVFGLQSAYAFDTPAGPSIVCVAAIAFLCTSVLRGLRPGN